MTTDGGKGSSRRKEDVSKIHENWDRIFGKKEPTVMEHIDDDECFGEELHDDDEWTCDSCGGPMYTAPHWNYGQCDDCGARQEIESDI